MQSNGSPNTAFGTQDVPPATPPTVNDNVDADQAAHTPVNGDSDEPGRIPNEIQPGQGDQDNPGSAPDEFGPGGGDIDQPDTGPAETPPQPGITPGETPPPD